MRILQFINALTWGGAQTLLLDLCRALQAAGHEVRVAAFRDGPIGERLRDEGVPVLQLSEDACDLAGIVDLRRAIAGFRPQLIHTHLFRATFWGRLACRSAALPIPILTSIHGHETAVYHRLERAMAARSTALIFPSRHLADWYEKEIRPIPDHRRIVIPPGVEIRERAPAERNPVLRDPVVQPPPGEPLVLSALARLHPVKGLDTLLEACALLRGQRLPFQLRIGGDGREKASLTELCRRLDLTGCVEFVGPVASPKDFLEGSDIFVSPSRDEAFGITVCEAMERGRPVVASSIGGHREIIRPGIDGELVPPNNPTELAATLSALLTDPARRTRLGKAARERVMATFPRRLALDEHLRLYEAIVDRERAAPAKTVLTVVSSGELGGGERMALALSDALAERRWNAPLLCGPGPLAEEARRHGHSVRVRSLRAGGLFFGLGLLGEIGRLTPAVVHTHLNKAALFASLFRPLHQKPVAAHVHGLNRSSYYGSCDRVIAVSEAVARHLLEQGLPADRLATLPNALPLDPSQGRPARARLSAALPGPGFPWVIGIIAKLHANKGHRWALRALAAAVEAGTLPPFEIRCFGDGPEESALRAEFDHGPLAGHLRWMGFRRDLPDCLPDLHVALLPSLGEGIPLSLLEAMRCGVPAVATAVGGIPEIVFSGENGVLVQPNDPEGLITALQTMLNASNWPGFASRAVAAFSRLNDFSGLVSRLDEELTRLTGPGSS